MKVTHTQALATLAELTDLTDRDNAQEDKEPVSDPQTFWGVWAAETLP